ncbi:unnamed protein product [Chilo suppressalis]|uniref:ABC transporter domain-containing protein n=1 Tax=Chilo suppressalis TaxID=168631 RepID=A0ABN8B3A6_CHISP|nr:unnamed protein product [Chilo suppressalis]
MPAILTKIREQASRVQPSVALGVGVGVALAACALYGTRERKQQPPCNNNNNYKVEKNGKLQTVPEGSAETCGGRCGADQCALCRGDADTDNKQNIADADEPTPPQEEYIPGLNLEFLRQLVSLAKIMVPGFRTQEVALLTAHTLCLFTRTLLSIYVASLEGSIVRHIVQKDLRRFAALLLQWFGIAIPATFTNSMIRYLEGRLALAFRTRLVTHAYQLYFRNQTYYKVANLDARIENADHRLTEDVSVFTQSVAHLYSSLTKPCFDLLLIVLTLATYSNKMKGNIFLGPGIAFVVICLTGQLLRLLSPRFGALAGEEARMKANLRHAHARLIAHAEEVAFYGGHKEVVTLAGYATRVSDMLTVFGEVARGKCVRTVHVAPCPTASFQVTFKDNQPVPMGKVTYTDDLSIVLRDVPIVTPACEVVASGLSLTLAPGTHLLIVGPNGCGKSSLFRIISGLWPVFGGQLAVPRPCSCEYCADDSASLQPVACNSRPIMFYIPQRPYMSEGTLLEQITYPWVCRGPEAEARARRVLRAVRLEACAARHGGLHAQTDWRATLSGGEKQRLAMARMFFHRPVYALLDECTSAVSMETEVVMYSEAVREGITLLSITHRPSVWKYHTHVLEFDGAGNWAYRPLDKEAIPNTPALTNGTTNITTNTSTSITSVANATPSVNNVTAVSEPSVIACQN